MVDDLVPKPNQILPSFQDRIAAPNPVNASAWLDGIHTSSARRARRRAKAEFDRRPQCRAFGPMPSSLGDGGRVTRRWSSKANFPQRRRSAIKNSKPFSVCWVANLTTFSWAPAAISGRWPVGTAAFVAQHYPF
jgi:hypothetical protein